MTLSLRHHWKKWFKDKVLPPIWLVMMRLLYVQQHLGKINWTMQFVLYRVIWLPEYSFKLRFWLGTEEAFCDHIWVLHRDEKKCKKIYLIHITVPQLASFTIMNTYCLTSLLDWLDNWNVRLTNLSFQFCNCTTNFTVLLFNL